MTGSKGPPRTLSVTAIVVLVNGCAAGSSTSSHDGGVDAGRPPCAVDSDAGVGVGGPPLCYPESIKPSGPCSIPAMTCAFCGYPPCSVPSGLIEPHTFYDCTCTAGAWSCNVVGRFGTECPAVLSCLGPDGGLGASCLSGGGESCEIPEGGASPICVFANGVVPPCGNDSCSFGCTCVDQDAATPTCACQ